MNTRVAQKGAVLAVALLLLAALTLFALGASQMTRSRGIPMATLQAREIAFQSAEAALKNAERLLATEARLEPCLSERCRVYSSIGREASQLRSTTWWVAHGWAYTEADTWVAVDSATPTTAMFIIERLEDLPDSLAISPSGSRSGQAFYRATAFARPAVNATPVVLQSTFSIRFE